MIKATLALLLFVSQLLYSQEQQTIFISTTNVEKTLYMNQVFVLDIKALIALKNIESVKSTLINTEGIEIIYEEPFEEITKNEYHSSLYIQVLNANAKTPDIIVDVTTSEGIYHQMYDGANLNIQDIKGSEHFPRVLPKSLSIIDFQSRQYDENNNIIQLNISAHTSNLFDFYKDSKFIIEQGVKDIDNFYPTTNLIYYAIIDKNVKIFEFEFFNLETLQMEKRDIPIRLDEERVSTQTDLMPKSNFLQLYEKIAIAFLTLLFLILFIYRKKPLYLFITIFFLGILIYLFIPTQTITLMRGSPIKILPTKNSTVFYTTPRLLEVEVLDSSERYKKILLKNEKVGWVHEKHIIKN